MNMTHFMPNSDYRDLLEQCIMLGEEKNHEKNDLTLPHAHALNLRKVKVEIDLLLIPKREIC